MDQLLLYSTIIEKGNGVIHQCHLFPSHIEKHISDLVDSWDSILQRPIKKVLSQII